MPNAKHYEATHGGDPTLPYSPVGCLVQLLLMLGGLVVAVVTWFTIAREDPWTITLVDGIYWIAVFGWLAARHCGDRLHGDADDSGPTKGARPHGRRYAWTVLLVSGLAWGIAQALEF